MKPTRRVALTRVAAGARRARDEVAVEEPLEIRVGKRSLMVTMRTPGHDADLARGLLFTEGLVAAGDIAGVAACRDVPPEARGNVVTVSLRRGAKLRSRGSMRRFIVSSACGVCGSSALEALRRRAPKVEAGPLLEPDLIRGLPQQLRRGQSVFASTGGLHAAALFDRRGRTLSLREDVGRHNAVDKVLGEALRFLSPPLRDTILMVSGRASFEIVHKARMAGIPVLCSVSAPSSLAVQLAADGGQTLIGFLREGRFNVYSGDERISSTRHSRTP